MKKSASETGKFFLAGLYSLLLSTMRMLRLKGADSTAAMKPRGERKHGKEKEGYGNEKRKLCAERSTSRVCQVDERSA